MNNNEQTEQPQTVKPALLQAVVSTSTFRDWEVYEVLPIGWKIDNNCGSPLYGYDFCTNGKSILNGGKRALVRSIRKGTPRIKFVEPKPTVSKMETTTYGHQCPEVKKKEPNPNYVFPAKSVNLLARKKFQEHLLKEITFDLMVCEIEGWDKKEYIKELKNLINSINTSSKKNVKSLPTLFSDVCL